LADIYLLILVIPPATEFGDTRHPRIASREFEIHAAQSA
jgi:hypothetical protein